MFRFSNLSYEDTRGLISPSFNHLNDTKYLDYNYNYGSVPLDLSYYSRDNYNHGELTFCH